MVPSRSDPATTEQPTSMEMRGTVEDAGENVAAEFVGAEEMMQRGRLEAHGEIDEGGIARGDERGRRWRRRRRAG